MMRQIVNHCSVSVFQYLWVVVSASFEIFVYKSNLQISLKPRWRSWWFQCIFLWMLFSGNANTDFKHMLLFWLKLKVSSTKTQTLFMFVRHVADVFCVVYQTNSFLYNNKNNKISYCFYSTSGFILPKVIIPKKPPRGLHLYLLIGICLSWLKSLCFLFFSSFRRSFSEELCFASCPSLLSLSSRPFASFSRSFSLSFSALLKWPVWCANPVNVPSHATMTCRGQ